MLPTWQLAIVLSTSDNEARVGWLSGLGVRGATTEPNLGEIPMSDVTWARPVHGEEFGPPPKRISDVMRTGDIVMIEPPQAATPPAAAETAVKPGKSGKPAMAQAELGVRPGSGLPKVSLRQIPADRAR